jgi:hypothetical protein
VSSRLPQHHRDGRAIRLFFALILKTTPSRADYFRYYSIDCELKTLCVLVPHYVQLKVVGRQPRYREGIFTKKDISDGFPMLRALFNLSSVDQQVRSPFRISRRPIKDEVLQQQQRNHRCVSYL